ncbi:hypothetical protein Y032_0016g3005 [Ancylostoma ceylanicum]|uniref:Uncharacterized protein n=1 Tax=Ancylostoma ceylanicum TaxID=53326 RepID=A0A016V601_9BILA|nr:hypothetical protein Y032_0016g3005 [Ancylostoma ceylanicum]
MISANDLAVTWATWQLTSYVTAVPPLDPRPPGRTRRFGYIVHSYFEKALVLLHSNQREPCRRALDELVGLFGTSKDSRLIEAALCFRLNEFEKAVNVCLCIFCSFLLTELFDSELMYGW